MTELVNYTLLSPSTKMYPGDYLKYVDEYNVVKGGGAFVKIIINKYFPLTKSYYLLININTKKMWKVKTNRYTFYHMKHVTVDSSNINDLFFTSEEFKKIKQQYDDNTLI